MIFANSKWIPSAQYLIELAEPCTDHEYEIDEVVYKNGFGESGTATYKCALCSAKKTISCEPIVYAKGYSISMGEYSITSGYTIDYDAKALYEKANKTTLSVGLFTVLPDMLTSEAFFVNGSLSALYYVQIEISDVEYHRINMKITNFQSTQLDVDVIMSAFVREIPSEGDEGKQVIHFVQSGAENVTKAVQKTDATLYSVSYNSINN